VNKLFVFIFLTFSVCFASDIEDITRNVESFFESFKTVPDFAKHFGSADKTLVSKDLYKLIKQAEAEEERDAKDVLKSDSPGDKPKIIEGSIYCSLYEGYDLFKIRDITRINYKYLAKVDFTNTQYNEKWTDIVLLVKEDGAWKIDDVIFNEQNSSTRKQLREFIAYQRY
jgi:hypothetical protein